MSFFPVRTYPQQLCIITTATYVYFKSWTPSWIPHKYWYSVPHIQLWLSFTSNFIRGPPYVGSVLLNFSLYSVKYRGTNSTLMYQTLSTGLKKYRGKFNYSTIQDWGIKKARCQEEKRPKHNAAIRQLPNLPSPPFHHSMTPTMKKRRRAPLCNQPQNKNNPKKHCLPHMLFNVLAEHKCSRWLLFLNF